MRGAALRQWVASSAVIRLSTINRQSNLTCVTVDLCRATFDHIRCLRRRAVSCRDYTIVSSAGSMVSDVGAADRQRKPALALTGQSMGDAGSRCWLHHQIGVVGHR